MNTITLGFLLVALLLMLMGLSSTDWVHQQYKLPKGTDTDDAKDLKVETAIGLFDACMFGSADSMKMFDFPVAGGMCGETKNVVGKFLPSNSSDIDNKLKVCKGLLIAAIAMLLVGLVALVAFPAHPWIGALGGLVATILAAACVMVFGITLKNKLNVKGQSKADVYGSGFYLVIVGVCLAGLGSMFSLGMEAKDLLMHHKKR